MPPPSLQLQQSSSNKAITNYALVNENQTQKNHSHHQHVHHKLTDIAAANEKLNKLFDSLNNSNRNSILLQEDKFELNNEARFNLSHSSNYTNNSNRINKPFKITPLLICTNENNQIILRERNISSNIDLNNNNTHNTICNCNFCLLNLAYLNKNCCYLESSKQLEKNTSNNNNSGILNLNKFNELKHNLVDYIELNSTKKNIFFLNKNLPRQKEEENLESKKPQEQEKTVISSTSEILPDKCLDEPIIYIDSIELDETSKNNNMNQLLAKLRPKSTTLKPSSSSAANQHHDYHVIDENNEETTRTVKKLSPSNSVESFEFISHNTNVDIHDEMEDPSVKSYEKSWENTTCILMEKLDKCLKDEQQQHFENTAKIIQNKTCAQCSITQVPATTASSSFFFNKSTIIPIKSITPIKLNCSLRDKKLTSLRNLNIKSQHRNSFPFKKSTIECFNNSNSTNQTKITSLSSQG